MSWGVTLGVEGTISKDRGDVMFEFETGPPSISPSHRDAEKPTESEDVIPWTILREKCLSENLREDLPGKLTYSLSISASRMEWTFSLSQILKLSTGGWERYCAMTGLKEEGQTKNKKNNLCKRACRKAGHIRLVNGAGCARKRKSNSVDGTLLLHISWLRSMFKAFKGIVNLLAKLRYGVSKYFEGTVMSLGGLPTIFIFFERQGFCFKPKGGEHTKRISSEDAGRTV
ncbi:hypothetical protein EV368DRAFT_62939 [Lentinula lateritia]|nr:hypothetical protein EV368DRAFT_62939 [Lentinula lateritia]